MLRPGPLPAGVAPRPWVYDLVVDLDGDARRYTVRVRPVTVLVDGAGRVSTVPAERWPRKQEVERVREHRFPDAGPGPLVPEGGWDLRVAENRELVRRAGRDLGWRARMEPAIRAAVLWTVAPIALVLLVVVVSALRDLT